VRLPNSNSFTGILILFAFCLSISPGCSNDPEVGKTQPKPEKTSEVTSKKESPEKTTGEKAPEKKEKTKPAPEPKKEKPKVPDVNDPAFHKDLLTAVDEYLRWGMANVVAMPAPRACAPATPPEPKPLYSKSDDEDSHGQKLYFLFAKDIAHYFDTESDSKSPVGQTIMKEAWTSKEASPQARNMRNHASGNRINPRAKVGDKVLEIGQRNNFFIMTKLDEDTPNTDQGWVYGVVDSDTKKVLAAGAVASCMNCHTDAKKDRLFGPLGITPAETKE